MTGRRPTAMRVGPIITVTDLDLSREFTMASSAWKGHRRGVVGGWVGGVVLSANSGHALYLLPDVPNARSADWPVQGSVSTMWAL